jgi:hypothetical protein
MSSIIKKALDPNDNHNMFDRIVRLHTPLESPDLPEHCPRR